MSELSALDLDHVISNRMIFLYWEQRAESREQNCLASSTELWLLRNHRKCKLSFACLKTNIGILVESSCNIYREKNKRM